jgi:hypothetical protein
VTNRLATGGDVIYTRPGYHACYGCTVVGITAGGGDKVAVCSHATKPRNPNHCAVWAMSEEQAANGGWWQHNQQRETQGLPREALDKDSPEHIQIITNYAQAHAQR